MKNFKIRNFLKRVNLEKIKMWRTVLDAYCNFLRRNRYKIARLIAKITNTPTLDHLNDIEYVISFFRKLNLHIELHEKYFLIPYGKVLIGLPSNEPVVNTLVPVVSALVAGNYVIVKPSYENRDIVKRLLSPLFKFGVSKNQLKIKYVRKDKIRDLIKKVDYVFWMGGYRSTRIISKICYELNKKFYFESEGINYSIIDESIDKKDLRKIVVLILKSLKIHMGKRCQTIRGILIHERNFNEFLREFLKCINKNQYSFKLKITKSLRDDCLYNSYNLLNYIFLGKYSNSSELINFLNKNFFPLSLYIFSRKKFQVLFKNLIRKVKYSRVVINKDPSKVYIFEPWGGIKNSGVFGPEAWINKFSMRMSIIV